MEAPRLEQAVLAAIIRDNNLIATARLHSISSQTFTNSGCKLIWEAICQELDRGHAADIITLSEVLPDMAADIIGLELVISTGVNFPTWVEKLKNAEAKRGIAHACRCAVADAEGKEDVQRIIHRLTGSIETARLTAAGKKIPTLADAAQSLKDNMLAGPPRVIPMFPPGTEGREKVVIHAGEMFILGARPGGGKTALCAEAVWNQLQAGHRVAYFCTESSTQDILARIVAAASGVPHYLPERSDAALFRFREFLNTIVKDYSGKLHIFGNDAGVITPSFIRQQLRAIEADGAADVVYVDFLQNMVADRRERSSLEEINSIVQSIHGTLAEWQAAGIIVSQFNRQSQQGEGVPDLTWLKDTSSLEQLAHTVAFLWRPKGEELTSLYSAKTRNCRPFNIKLSWKETKFISQRGEHGNPDQTAQ